MFDIIKLELDYNMVTRLQYRLSFIILRKLE